MISLVTIGTDRTVFQQGSTARGRMIEYGALFSELHIVVFAKRSLKLQPQQIAANVWIHPTQSFFKFLYFRNARQIIGDIITSRNLKPDATVISAQDPYDTGRVGVSVKKIYHVPLQLQVHTDIFDKHFYQQSFLNRYRVKAAEKFLPYADEIRVVSETVKRSLLQRLPISESNVDVLPIYVDKEKYHTHAGLSEKRFSQFTFTILMASRLTPEKNIGFALDVFHQLVLNYPGIGLFVVGAGSEEVILKKKVQELGLEKSVVFQPWTYDLVAFYASADMFLLTSVFEGYGMTLIEAGLMGLPIVTSRVGIAKDILVDEKNALIRDVNDTQAFVESISRLMTNSDLRKMLSHNVQKDVAASLPEDKAAYLAQYKMLVEKAAACYMIKP